MLLLGGRGSTLGLTHGRPFQFDAMGIMKQSVAEGIGLIRVSDDGMPIFDRELACDQG